MRFGDGCKVERRYGNRGHREARVTFKRADGYEFAAHHALDLYGGCATDAEWKTAEDAAHKKLHKGMDE